MEKKRRARKKLEDFIKARWLRIIIREFSEIINNFIKHGGTLLAAAISFYTILSVVPFLLVFTSIIAQIIHSSQFALQETLSFITRLFPSSGDSAIGYINALVSKKLAFGIIGGLAFYWAGSRTFEIMIIAVERIYEKKERGFFMHQKIFSFALIPILLATFALFVGLSKGIVFLRGFISIGTTASEVSFITSFSNNLLIVGIATGFFFILYRVFSYRNTDSVSALSGALFTSILTMVVKYLFDWYIRNFNHFGKIYGSLSAIIIALLWIYYTSIIYIIGAELTAYIHRKRIKKLNLT